MPSSVKIARTDFLGPVVVTRDGKFWAYTVNRNIVSELWQVNGLAMR